MKTLLLFCSIVTRSAKKVFRQLIGRPAAICVATATRDQEERRLAASGVSCGDLKHICERHCVKHQENTYTMLQQGLHLGWPQGWEKYSEVKVLYHSVEQEEL